MVKVNSLQNFNKILETDFNCLDDLHKYMKQNKTECALKVFDTKEELKFPDYIIEAIK
jgi:putative ATP-dependent endonuclease of OLD family